MAANSAGPNWLTVAAYDDAKTRNPGAGRRQWTQNALSLFWKTVRQGQQNDGGIRADTSQDSAPFDDITIKDDESFGIVLRTDFLNNEAWHQFTTRLKDAENDMRATLMAPSEAGEPSSSNAEPNGDEAMGGQEGENAEEDKEESSDDEDDADALPSIIRVLDPSALDASLCTKFAGISNLAALRLFNDVNVRPAPPPPKGTARDDRQSPLIDLAGWQEIYEGKDLWIYDGRSNDDMSVRVVSGRSEDSVYGSATGDSWRARVGHIYDLQYNMRVGGMKIDFGGLDRWDYSERLRNLQEAALSP